MHDPPLNPLPCPFCPAKKKGLAKHIETKHPDECCFICHFWYHEDPEQHLKQEHRNYWLAKHHGLKCPDCGGDMKLTSAGRGRFYGCLLWPECRGTHSAHKDGTPMGIPADQETRILRRTAHAVFDRLWSSGHMSRTDAYTWMGGALNLEPDEAHIGRFDRVACKRLIEAVWTYTDSS